MASLVKRGEYWYVKYNDASGRQTMVKGYSDKRETQGLANRLEDEKTKIKRGDIDPKAEQRKIERAKLIDTHIAEYETMLTAAKRRQNHIDYTIGDIRKFVAFTATLPEAAGLPVTHAEKVTRDMVAAWSKSLQDAGVDAHRTINRRLGSLQAFLSSLKEDGKISEYVAYKFPKLATKGHEKRPPKAMTPEQQAKLLAADIPAERLEVYRFLLGCGARFSAAQELTVGKINLQNRTMSLKRKTKGGGSPEYTVPIHQKLVPMLAKRCEGKEPEVLAFPDIPVRSMAETLQADCIMAGIKAKGFTIHGLRHTFVTTLALANIHPNVVQALAGHRDVNTTLKYYTHLKRVDEIAALDVLKL